MCLLKLQDVNKIYSANNVLTIGIQEVNLEFELGEFVAITGKSGSGKTTLLNIMSGLDSYEDGEMFVNGEETSHFGKKDWEDYIQQYVSFIFQDYNIIECFTVLENVEFALMHITDLKARRQKALELIDKVGLSSSKSQKGSTLSGGQKQRTVIARALAKDSPMIFADEPTGNLDAQTSREIIQLLADIAKEKLLVMVTHSFDEVKDYATREIRVFDGKVVRDDRIQRDKLYMQDNNIGQIECQEHNLNVDQAQSKVHNKNIQKNTSKSQNNSIESTEATEATKKLIKKIQKPLREGVILGAHQFVAQPKLSVLLCASFSVAIFVILFIIAGVGGAFESFTKNVFQDIDGRVIIFKQDETSFVESELQDLADKYGCDYIFCDTIYDKSMRFSIKEYSGYKIYEGYGDYSSRNLYYIQPMQNDVLPDYGRLPQSKNEVFLFTSIAEKDLLINKNKLTEKKIIFFGAEYTLSGVKFFYDNTKKNYAQFTQEGFDDLSASLFLDELYNISNNAIKPPFYSGRRLNVSSMLEGDEYVYYNGYKTFKNVGEVKFNLGQKEYIINPKQDVDFSYSYLKKEEQYDKYKEGLYISTDLAKQIMQQHQTRASLIFKNNKTAKENIAKITEHNYFVLMSDIKILQSQNLFNSNENGLENVKMQETIISIVMLNLYLISMVVLSLIFSGFFTYLITIKSRENNKKNVAIMQSMGIRVKIIKSGVMWQNCISVGVAIVVNIVLAIIMYTIPLGNNMLKFLKIPEYLYIFVSIMLLVLFVSRKFNKKMFNQTVRKNLKGGSKK